jgi:voltage-gated potassium channel
MAVRWSVDPPPRPGYWVRMRPTGSNGEEVRHPILERQLSAKPLTPFRAGRLIATATLCLTLAGGLAAWLFDRRGVGGLGDSLWWALQTVTTVGYGDVVPEGAVGRIVGGILMLNGIALISVVTAIVTATLVEQVRRRHALEGDTATQATLERIEARLSEIEAALDQRGRSGDR